MTIADDLEDVRDELAHLYVQQSQSERAAFDGRMTDPVELRAAIDRRAERIRVLERRRVELEREYAEQEEAAA